jgi:hemerythrin superfamily protein
MDATELLEKDHDKVEALFQQIEAGASGKKGETLFTKIYHELSIHAIIEEQVFYPGLARFSEFSGLLKDAYSEHAEAKRAMGEIASLDSSSEEWQKKVAKLQKDIQHHVKDEEEKLFPKVREKLSKQELSTLGQELAKAKTSNLDGELLSQPLYLSSSMANQAQL